MRNDSFNTKPLTSFDNHFADFSSRVDENFSTVKKAAIISSLIGLAALLAICGTLIVIALIIFGG